METNNYHLDLNEKRSLKNFQEQILELHICSNEEVCIQKKCINL